MKFYLLLILFLSCFFVGHTQEVMSLSDAIALCLERNYDIRIERRNVDIASNNNSWGAAGKLPTITFDLSSNNSVSNQESDNQFFGGQLFPGYELNDQRSYSLNPTLNVNWTIFEGNKAVLTKRRLAQLEAESMQNAEVVVANTLQAVILAYYMAVLERDRVEAYFTQLELSRDRYRYTHTKYEMGSAVTTDLLLEENNYLTDSTNYINQQLTYHNALRNLNLLLVNDDLNEAYVFSDSLMFEEKTYDYEDLEARMLSENVDIRKIYVAQSILETQVKEARADRYPTVGFNGGYQWNRNVSDLTHANYNGPNTDYQNPPEPLLSKTGTYFANFSLAFNLFDGGRVNRAIRNQVVEEEIGHLKIEQLQVSLRQDLAEAYERYEIRKRLYGISVRSEEAAQVNLDVSTEKYKGGTINSFDFRVVQNNYLTASVSRLQALYNLMDSKVELMRLTGGLISDNSDAD